MRESAPNERESVGWRRFRGDAFKTLGDAKSAGTWKHFLYLGLAVIVAEGIAELLNAQSQKMSGVSLVWLPNGLVVGAMLCSTKKRWPAYLLLGSAIDLAYNFGAGGTIATSLVYAAFNTIEILVAASLLYKPLTRDPDLTQPAQLRAFLLYGVLIAPLITALSAACYLHFHDGVAVGQSVQFWFAADMLGLATVTPLYLSFHHGHSLSSRSRAETGLLFAILCIVVAATFGYSSYPSLWIVLLAILLLGVRAGFTASALGLLIVISVGGFLSISGRGPLGTNPNHTLAHRTLYFQSFVGMAMIALYITEVAMTANRKAQAGLQESEARYRALADELERRVEDRTMALKKEIAEREVIQHHLMSAKLLAEESNRAKSTFLANMSHEVRTPLNAILGYSELLQEDASERGDASAVRDLERVQAAGRHLLTIINDVLDLSKIESGHIEIQCGTVSIRSVVEEVAATIAPLARAQNNAFEIRMTDPERTVFLDVVKFRQCLLNLLSNACKFTENGTITFEVITEDKAGAGRTRWIVRDTGIGIAPENLDRLFVAFSQVDSSSTRKHDGTGLGLAISRRLVRLMGGDITLETEYGRGSAFSIEMPQSEYRELEQFHHLESMSGLS